MAKIRPIQHAFRMAPDWHRYEALLRAALGIDPEEAPPDFRALFQPTFSADCCVTIRGGELTFSHLASGVRSHLMTLAGVGGMGSVRPPERERVEKQVTIPPAERIAFQQVMSALDPASLPDALLAERDGIQLVGQCRSHVFRASSPTPEEAPRHHAFFAHICALAVSLLPDQPPLAAVKRHLGLS